MTRREAIRKLEGAMAALRAVAYLGGHTEDPSGEIVPVAPEPPPGASEASRGAPGSAGDSIPPGVLWRA